MLKAAALAYPKARGIEKKYYQGFFDLTFHNAADAEEAAAIPLVVNNRRIPTSRCRWNQDETIYITLTKIPTTLTREDTIKQLTKGLETYGEIINFEMESDDILNHLTMPRAIAIIKPNEEVLADLTLIPQSAYLYDDQTEQVTEGFRISPETAPPICGSCNCIGHQATACPKTVEGIQQLMDEQDDDMDDDNKLYTNDHEYPWGETANYKVVELVTPHARRAAKKAIARQRREEREAMVAEVHSEMMAQITSSILETPDDTRDTHTHNLTQQENVTNHTSITKNGHTQEPINDMEKKISEYQGNNSAQETSKNNLSRNSKFGSSSRIASRPAPAPKKDSQQA